MCSSNSSTERAQKESGELAQAQFDWQKEQAAQAAMDAQAKRAAMEKGLVQIGNRFSKFDRKYYDGIEEQFRNFANPQVEKAQSSAAYGLASALANRGKLGSSTDARQTADLTSTFGGIYRDTEMKAQDYANQQRQSINSAKQSAISQMYASESADAGLQAAGGAVQSFRSGPAYEPISGILAQASKFATLDYNNSIYNGKSNGMFSPLFAGAAAPQAQNSPTSGGDVKNYNGI